MSRSDVEDMLIRIDATTENLRRELRRGEDSVVQATTKIDQQLGKIDSAFDRVGSKAQAAGNLIRSALAIAVGSGTVGGLLNVADAYGQMADRMRMATASSGEYVAVQARLLETANRTYRPLAEAQELFIRTAGSLQSLGYNTRQVLDVTDSFSYLLVTNAASAERANSAINAYSRSIQTGKVESKSWQAILAAMPTVVDVLAESTGRTTEEVRRLGIEGKLSLTELNEALRQSVEENGRLADTMTTSVKDAFVALGNSIQVYIGQLNESTGATGLLAGGVVALAGNVDSLANVLAVAGVAALTAYAAKGAAAAKTSVLASKAALEEVVARRAQADAVLQAAIADQRKAQTATLLAAREAAAARGTAVQTQMSIQLAQARMREAAATQAVTAAQAGLRAASYSLLGLLGGPMGLALLAGTVATTFLVLKDNSSQLEKTLGDLAAPLDEVVKKFNQLNEASQAVTLRALMQEIADLQAQVNDGWGDLSKDFERDVYGHLIAYGMRGERLAEETEMALERVRQASADAAAGIEVNWKTVADSIRGVPGVTDEMANAIERGQGAVVELVDTLQAKRQVLKALTGDTEQNTAAQLANNQAQQEAVEAGDKYIAQLQKQLAGMQDKSALEAANRFIAEHTDLTEAQVTAIRSLAAAQDAQRAADARSTASRKASTKAIDDQLKALDALIARALPERKRLEELTRGIDGLRKAQAHGLLSTQELEEGIRNLNEQYASPAVREREAAEKALADQLKQTADSAQSILDRLDPAAAATRRYREEQDVLRRAMEQFPERANEMREALDRLGIEYQRNQGQASAWATFTEGAIDRVDEAFADAWKRIGSGFDGFADGLKNSFKQLLAELAHMLITKPLILQVGAALGVGGLAGAAGSGASGGVGNLLSMGQSLYSAFTGWGPAAMAGWQSGGVMGAVQGIGSHYGGLLGGGLSGLDAGAGQLIGTLTQGGGMSYAPLSYQLQHGALGGQLAAAAPWLAGIGGALYGYGRSGWKGAATGAAGGVGGAYGGAMLGNLVLPGIGGLIGGALGGLLGSSLGGSLFGGKWQTKDMGLELGVDGGDFFGRQYEFLRKKGGLGRKNKKRTRYSALDADTDQALREAFQATEDSVLDLFERLGADVDEAVLNGLTLARTQISTKGKSAEAINAEIASWFQGVADAMADSIDQSLSAGLAEAGQGLTFERLEALVLGLEGSNAVLGRIKAQLIDLSPAGALAAESLLALFDGLDGLAEQADVYYQAFIPAVERFQDSVDGLRSVFEGLELELPGVRDGFRELVASLDLNDAAARETFATLMGLAPAMDAYYQQVESLHRGFEQAFVPTAELSARALQALQSELAGLGLSLPNSRAGFRELVDGIDTTTDAGRDLLLKLQALVPEAAAYYQQLEQLQQQYEQAFVPAVELSQRAVDSLREEFAALGLELPGSREAFRDLVGGIDTTSEAGQALRRKLLELVPAMQGYLESLAAQQQILQTQSGNAVAVVDRALAGLSASIAAEKAALQNQLAAQLASLDAQVTSSRQRLNELTGLANNLASALRSMRLESEAFERMRFAQARAQITSTLAIARAGGALQGIDLSAALSEVGRINTDLYASFEDYARDYGQTANEVAELEALVGKQLSHAEQTVQHLDWQRTALQASYDQQAAALDAQLAAAQLEVDAIHGVDNSVKSLAEAMAALREALLQAKADPLIEARHYVAQTFREAFGKEMGSAGLQAWSLNLASGRVGRENLAESIARDILRVDPSQYVGPLAMHELLENRARAEQYLAQLDAMREAARAIPGFAAGGLHGGGWRIVGEQGPELEYTPPTRIFNAGQTRDLLSQDALLGELRLLRDDMGRVWEGLYSIARHTLRTTKQLERWDFDGMPDVREPA